MVQLHLSIKRIVSNLGKRKQITLFVRIVHHCTLRAEHDEILSKIANANLNANLKLYT